jgi:3-oxoacyl-[acyl-carrier protein] reductase
MLAPGREALDVTCERSVRAYFENVPEMDVLICQAGMIDDARVERTSVESFEQVLAVNLTGAFRATRAVLESMLRRGQGHIILVGSFAALRGAVGQASYAAAKAGVIGLTKALALEYGARGVRANCVLPGLLETRMTERVLASEAKRQELLDQHALRRFNTVEDAARFIVFLDSMAHVSGQVFQLDSRVGRWA